MGLEIIKTDKAPAAMGPYSQGVAAGGFVFVSGQLGVLPESGEFAGSDLTSQARQALENMRQVLAAAGCNLDQVTAVDVYLTDMGNFAAFNEIYQEYFDQHRPARAAVAVRALPKDGLVEVKCSAYCPA